MKQPLNARLRSLASRVRGGQIPRRVSGLEISESKASSAVSQSLIVGVRQCSSDSRMLRNRMGRRFGFLPSVLVFTARRHSRPPRAHAQTRSSDCMFAGLARCTEQPNISSGAQQHPKPPKHSAGWRVAADQQPLPLLRQQRSCPDTRLCPGQPVTIFVYQGAQEFRLQRQLTLIGK